MRMGVAALLVTVPLYYAPGLGVRLESVHRHWGRPKLRTCPTIGGGGVSQGKPIWPRCFPYGFPI